MPFKPFGAGTYFLGSSISSTDTTILLSSFLEPVTGTPYTMTLLGTDIVYGTIGPRTSQSEFISFTGITQNDDGSATLTGVTRGLAKKTPFTSDNDYKLPHAGQSIFIISDAPQLFNEYSVIENDEVITGKKQFPAGGSANAPVSGASYSPPTDNLEYASKKYVDDIAIAGSPNATTIVKGIVQLPTQAQVDAKTAVGSTGASLTPTPANLRATKYNDPVIDTGSTNAYSIVLNPTISAYVSGQVIGFKATHANTGASTLKVDSLGTVSITKRGTTALDANDILSGMDVMVEYDGSNSVFQMISPVGNAPMDLYSSQTVVTGTKIFTVAPQTPAVPATGNDIVNKTYVDGNPITSTNGITTRVGDTASGSQVIAHGLGRTPKLVRIYANKFPSTTFAAPSISNGVYNGSTVASAFSWGFDSGGGTTQGGADESSTNIISIKEATSGSKSQVATIAVDATNITLTWTKASTPSNSVINIMWEAQ